MTIEAQTIAARLGQYRSRLHLQLNLDENIDVEVIPNSVKPQQAGKLSSNAFTATLLLARYEDDSVKAVKTCTLLVDFMALSLPAGTFLDPKNNLQLSDFRFRAM